MARHYYCSKCGEELILKRKALRNKQVVIDVLDPHTCDEELKFIANITDDERPPTNYELQSRKESSLRPSHVANEDDKVFQDQRDHKFMRDPLKQSTSSAPLNILNQIRGGLHNTKAERPLDIPDDEA